MERVMYGGNRKERSKDSLRLSGFRGEISSVEMSKKPTSETIPSEKGFISKDINLKEMAEWALHHIINNPRKGLDYECQFSIRPLAYPPVPTDHDPVTVGDTDVRLDRKFIFMREMCGSKEGLEVQKGLRRRILKYVRDDGFAWVPLHHYCISDLKDFEPAVSPWATGLIILSLCETYELTGEEKAKDLAQKMVRALIRLAKWDKGRAYYEGGSGPWRDGKWIDSFVTTNHQCQLEPIVRYWEVTKDQEAVDFAMALAEGTLANLQKNLGTKRIESDGSFSGHTMLKLHAVWGVVHLGVLTDNPRYLEWAKGVYDFVLSNGIDFGWSQERMLNSNTFKTDDYPDRIRVAETCNIGDMVDIASWIARSYPDYYDHIERYIRNYIRECQFFVTPEYEALYRKIHKDRPKEAEKGLEMMRKLEGGFVGWPRPNDLVRDGMNMELFGCCQAGGIKTLYTAWQGIVTEKPEGVFINLCFNKETEEAKVISFLPESGRLTVMAKKEKDYFLRPPSWTPRDEVKAYRNNKLIETSWEGNYVKFPSANPGEELTAAYPLLKFTQIVTINPEISKETFTIHWEGNTVKSIEPEGKYLPLFKSS